MTTKETMVCVRCGYEVKPPVESLSGVLIHTGHKDASLDKTCGWWGWRVVPVDEALP